MKTLFNSKLVFVLVALLWVTTSCQKEHSFLNNGTPNTGQSDFMKGALVQNQFDDMCDIIDNSYSNSSSSSKISDQNDFASFINSCGTVTIDTISFPRVITIDFGPTNCLSKDGHLRRGKLIATFAGAYRTPGSVTTYSTLNYYQDNIKLDVNRTVTNLGYITDKIGSNLNFSISEYVKITLPLGLGSITQQSEINRQWIKGDGTSTSNDDEYLLTGGHTTDLSNGTQFDAEIKVPLHKFNSYPFYTSGDEKVSSTGSSPMSYIIDYTYPNGDQDDQALVTYSTGQSEVIQLK